ncbi:hypothetical protein [Suttonella indologenes]|uniref:Uncharacterized protein n=1 Tax=Suttonella indologenes TaxID=13276 RepID=A0A380N0N6_9GAMM|nr:hypothetical protein [Suttonella indologenes]SUO98088.1 Uncharacterised protein [Suttonella indologenes]
MADFSRIELLADSSILEQHEFPLFEYTGLYLQLRSQAQTMDYCCIVVDQQEAQDADDEKLLNLVAASGYVDDDSDITFRISKAEQYFYTYFNFKAHDAHLSDSTD